MARVFLIVRHCMYIPPTCFGYTYILLYLQTHYYKRSFYVGKYLRWKNTLYRHIMPRTAVLRAYIAEKQLRNRSRRRCNICFIVLSNIRLLPLTVYGNGRMSTSAYSPYNVASAPYAYILRTLYQCL